MRNEADLGKVKNRLNQLFDRLKSPNLLERTRLGNELNFYIFDYPPEWEMIVDKHVGALTEQLENHSLKIKRIDLLALAISILRKRDLLEKAKQFQLDKGDEYLQKTLKPIFNEENFTRSFLEAADPDGHDLVLVGGVGSVFPLVRSHTLLSNLHSKMRDTPLILFYPGSYDSQYLTLFNKIKSKDYYRAFRLA